MVSIPNFSVDRRNKIVSENSERLLGPNWWLIASPKLKVYQNVKASARIKVKKEKIHSNVRIRSHRVCSSNFLKLCFLVRYVLTQENFDSSTIMWGSVLFVLEWKKRPAVRSYPSFTSMYKSAKKIVVEKISEQHQKAPHHSFWLYKSLWNVTFATLQRFLFYLTVLFVSVWASQDN